MPDKNTDDEAMRRIVADVTEALQRASDALPLTAQMAVTFDLEAEPGK